MLWQSVPESQPMAIEELLREKGKEILRLYAEHRTHNCACSKTRKKSGALPASTVKPGGEQPA